MSSTAGVAFFDVQLQKNKMEIEIQTSKEIRIGFKDLDIKRIDANLKIITNNLEAHRSKVSHAPTLVHDVCKNIKGLKTIMPVGFYRHNLVGYWKLS